MTTTPPTPKPTPKPLHAAAVDEILTVMREFNAIIAKHDPANKYADFFQVGQVWKRPGVHARQIVFVYGQGDYWVEYKNPETGTIWSCSGRELYGWCQHAQLIEDPNATTPAPTSGEKETQ